MNILQAFESAVDLFLGLRRPVVLREHTETTGEPEATSLPDRSRTVAVLEAPARAVPADPALQEAQAPAQAAEPTGPAQTEHVNDELGQAPDQDGEAPAQALETDAPDSSDAEVEHQPGIDLAELAVIEAAAKESLRYALNAVHVTRFFTEASDGHRLYRVYAEHPRPEGFQNLLLSLDCAKELVKALKAHKPAFRWTVIASMTADHTVRQSSPRNFSSQTACSRGAEPPHTGTAQLRDIGPAERWPGKRIVGPYLAAAAKFTCESEKALGGDSLGVLPFHFSDHKAISFASRMPEGGTPPRAFALLMPLDE